MITVCPNCSTRFNVRPEQLTLAKGLVRCGNCMTVFHAARSQAHAKLTPSNREPTQPTGKPTQAADTPTTATPANARPNTASPTAETAATKTPIVAEKDDALDAGPEQELSPSLLNLPKQSKRDLFSYEVADDDPDLEAPLADDERWAESLLEELEKEPDQPSPKTPSERESNPFTFSAETPNNSAIPFSAAGVSKLDQDIADFFTESEAVERPSKQPTQTKPTSKPPDRDRLLKTLRDEPITHKHPSNWRARGRFWLSLFVLTGLLGVLSVQILTYQASALAKYPSLRPLLEHLCERLNCEIPSTRDVKQLKSLSVSTRQHPELANRLLVDAVIFSLSSVPQPFPNLLLRFNDIRGKEVAKFIVTPVDYRRGDLLQLDAIPPGKSLHLKFEVKDPGPDAANYTLHFNYPATPQPVTDTLTPSTAST